MSDKAEKGLVAAEREEPVLKFSVLKSLPYGTRMVLVAALAVFGVAIQVATMHPLTGLPFILAAVVISWVVGFDNKLDRRSFTHDVAWESVPFDRIEEIETIGKKNQSWDVSPVDISNGLGCVLFLILAAGIVVATIWSSEWTHDWVPITVATDGVLLVLAQWFSGMRGIHRMPDLDLKVKHILAALKTVRSDVERRGGELKAQLHMCGKDDKRLPKDVKLLVGFPDGPEDFYGVQAQVVLNRVQGTPYPYLYAVVVAKKDQGLLVSTRKVARPDGVIRETKSTKDVDITIVRQRTTKTSGYHTKPEASSAIIRTALAMAALHLKEVKA